MESAHARSVAEGQVVELSLDQRSESVHPRSVFLMHLVAIVAASTLTGHLQPGLSLAPLVALFMRLVLVRLGSIQAACTAVGLLAANALFLSADDLHDFSSQDAFGLLPLAGFVCLLLFNIMAFKPTASRLAMAGGATSVLLLVQLSISQSLVRSVLVGGLFSLIWVALASRRSPACIKPARLAAREWWNFRFGLKTAFVSLALSIPLTVAFFLLFPRIPLDLLRSEQTENSSASIGLSDSLSLGSISRLQKTNDPAFEATFRDAAPADVSLYWRAMVLDRLDGNVWSSSAASLSAVKDGANSQPDMPPPQESIRANGIAYLSAWAPGNNNSRPVVLDGTAGRLFASFNNKSAALLPRSDGTYALPMNGSDQAPEKAKIHVLSGYLDRSYQLEADLDASNTDLSAWKKLPENFNPRTQAFGRDLRRKNKTDDRVIAAFLDLVQRENYHYTLRPPRLGAQAIDDFFLETRAGFCEHYASAFVVAMRSAGIPARLVSGYLSGGAVNGRVKVGQRDAHAWAEVWLPGRGWIRQDPTASIAPSRVDPDAANARLESAPDGFFGFLGLSWSKYSMQAEKAWSENLLGFDADRQEKVFQKLGIANASKPLLLVSSMLLVVGLSFVWQYFGGQIAMLMVPRSGNAISRLLARRCRRIGLERAPGQTWRGLAMASQSALETGDAKELLSIVALYERAVYARGTDRAVMRALIKRISAFKPKKKRSAPAQTPGLPRRKDHPKQWA